MQIKSTNDIKPTRINALIFGKSGVGKTTLASTLKGTTVIISMESGLMSLRHHPIDYVEIKCLDDLRHTLDELSKSDYDNIYIDSLSEVGQMFLDYSKLKYPDDRQTMKMYGYLLEVMTKFIKYCRDIDKNVFFTALQKTTQDDAGRRFHTPDLQGSIATKCGAFFDFVFNYQIIKKDDEMVRCLVTSGTDNTIAKDRSGVLDKFEKPDLGLIIDKVFTKEN